jgi:hypothetical protein
MCIKFKLKLSLVILTPILFFSFTSNSIAVTKIQKKQWETEYTAMLNQPATTPEEKIIILKNAIARALDRDAPSCEVMRIAIGLDYKPYFVIRYIYEKSKHAKLDELCWCSASDGIEAFIISKAAADARTSDNNPVFRQNEIAKSDCLKKGLAYTAELNSPDPIIPPEPPPPNPRSPITP